MIKKLEQEHERCNKLPQQSVLCEKGLGQVYHLLQHYYWALEEVANFDSLLEGL